MHSNNADEAHDYMLRIKEILFPTGNEDVSWSSDELPDVAQVLYDYFEVTGFPLTDDTIPTCDICGIPEEGSTLTWNGDTGCHVECERVRDAQAGWRAYKAERNRLGI